MDAIENLYMAVGELAYAVAMTDGKLQPDERQKFQEIVTKGLNQGNRDLDIADIIFKIMSKDKTNASDAYDQAIKEIHLNSHYVSPQMKSTFISVMADIAKAYLPVTAAEHQMIEKFKSEITGISGDPALYGNNR